MTATGPDRDETGAVVPHGWPAWTTYVRLGAVALALFVGLLGGWALGAGGDEAPEGVPAVSTTVDAGTLASCREAVTLARQGFGYAAEGLRAAEDGITALRDGDDDAAAEAAQRLRSEIASVMESSPRFNAAAADC